VTRAARSPALFDPWRVLGVRDDATPAEIRRGFRHAALRHHPDRNHGDPSAAERFREAHDAYELLMQMHQGAAARTRRAPERPYRVRCVVVGTDLVGVLPEAAGQPGRWVPIELLAAKTCPCCLGEGGETVTRALVLTRFVECTACDGVGLLRVERRLKVRLPATPARALRLRGRGISVANRRGDAILQLG